MTLSSSVVKALQVLEDGNKLDCRALLDNTFHTFSLLERWDKAESNVHSVQSIIQQVQHHGSAYFQTLGDSIYVAISLNALAEDVVWLVNALLDPDCPPEDIRDFVTEMQGYSREALEKSRHISTTYREVRSGIHQISNDIPGQMARLERRTDRLVAKNEALERRISRARVAKNIGTVALAVAGGVATFALPPLLLILPVGLTIAMLGCDAYENRNLKTLKRREDEILDCRTGLQQLRDITEYLAGLGDHVDLLIEFWLRSDTMLETISAGINRLRDNRARLRLKAIAKQWKSAGETYASYVTQASIFSIQASDWVA
ncbi:hypothetical protein DFH06DRAFT_1320424 [Mycena polygramma]|nr:hypothetical protein DFH06DRAFT_1320424 [Mycena polygramma]